MRTVSFLGALALLGALASPATAATINGTAGDDDLTGTVHADTIKAYAGNDTVSARGGADTVAGGLGDDVINGGYGNDRLNGGRGRDRLVGGRGADILDDSHRPGRDVLRAGPGADTVYANGPDQVYGGSENDYIVAVYPSTTMRIDCGTGVDEVVFNQPHPGVVLIGCEKVSIVPAG